MTTSTMELLPGTEVHARGLRWEVVSTQSLGPQTLFRLRGLENAVLGQELDVLHPFEQIEPIRHDLRPDRAAPLVNWLVYHQAFLLEQALGPDALLAVQPGRLRIEPYQLVPVLRAIRMSRVRLLLADGVGLGKTCEAGLTLTELIARRLCGDDPDKVRQARTERFRTQQGIILLSTDSAAEGLNLHQRCHHLIHLELPFNPNRLEQRNGRIDRYGQQYEPIVRYLFLRGTFEDRILLRLIAKYERQRARLTFVPNTLGLTTSSDAAQARLLAGIMEEDTKLFREEPTLFDFREGDEAEGADDATKELLEEIDRSLKGFEQAARTNTWLGEAGLNAEEKLLAEASEARAAGDRVGAVDLAAFVCDAVRLDGGQLVGQHRRRPLPTPPAARVAIWPGRLAGLRR